MTPIKSTEYLNHPNRLTRPCTVVDLRDLNMVHAAPIENDRPVLMMRFDPKSGALVPRDPNIWN